MGFEPTTLRVLDRMFVPSGAQIFFCVLLWLILYISLYFLYNMNPKEFSVRKEAMYPNPERIIFHSSP